MKILLFKTNIKKSDLPKLSLLLNEISGIKKWTVDLDDCDCVLRIGGAYLSLGEIQGKLEEVGFDIHYMPVDFMRVPCFEPEEVLNRNGRKSKF